jgi:hypothetical protein
MHFDAAGSKGDNAGVPRFRSMFELSWRDAFLVRNSPAQLAIVACWYVLVAKKLVPKIASVIAIMLFCGTTTGGLNLFYMASVGHIYWRRDFFFVVLIALEEYGVLASFFFAFRWLSKLEPGREVSDKMPGTE